MIGACVVAVASACGSFGGNDTEATADGGDGGQSTPETGATTDAGDDGRCTVLVDDSFDDGGLAAWKALGKARFVSGEVELVPDETGATGAIWMNVQNARDGVLHAKFVSKISPNGDDGLTFAWTANQDITLGGTGANYGVCGAGGNANGLAVAVSGNGQRLRVLDLMNNCAGVDVAMNPYGTNDVEITVRGVQVEIIFAGTKHVLAAPRAVLAKAIGFTAATGGGHARHAVDSVHVEVCSE
jgi:hypothetical protein